MKSYDCVVIGGGPAGMTAALYLLRSGARIAMIEKLTPGGQILMTESLDNYPGFPKGIKGYEFVDLLKAHLEDFEFDHFTDEVLAIEHKPCANRIQVGKEWIESKTVIIASGASFKRLDIPGEIELLGRGVSYCALCDGNFFRDQVVAVVGGGNSALEESLYLAKLVKEIHIIHRRDEFRRAKFYQDKIFANPKIKVHFNCEALAIEVPGKVEKLHLKDNTTGRQFALDVDGVFIFIGFNPQGNFLPREMTIDRWGFVLTDNEMRTNLSSIFAAGDIRSKLCRQVTTAVGDGATAANAAFIHLEQSNV